MIKDLLLWIYWHPFKRIVQKIPPGMAHLLARTMGNAAFVLAIRKRRAYERELAAIPGSPREGKELDRILRETFQQVFSNEIEVLRFPMLNTSNIGAVVECRGIEHLDAALARGKGVMLLFGHFGANQMIMPAVGYRGYAMSQMSAPATVWAEKLPNRTFSAMEKESHQLRWNHELSLPVRHINIFGSLKEVFACLKRNEILGVAVDGGGGSHRVAVPFLGRQALISKGAAQIAMRTGCTVLPTFMVRGGSGKNTMIIEPPLDVRRGADADTLAGQNLRLFMERFETYVIRHPSHYLPFLTLRHLMEQQGDTPLFSDGGNAG
jgi:KDO2-lipid IV(A) lauroyltransferase